MVVANRICPVCNKFFSSTANFKIHLNRKKPCIDPKLTSNAVLRPKNFKCARCEVSFDSSQKLKLHTNRQKPCKIKQVDQQLLVEQLQLQNNQLIEELTHQKTLNEQLQLEKSSNIMNNSHNNTIHNNTINNNTTNNINIHVYGKEDLSHITNEMYRKCMCVPHKSIEKLFEMIHFSEAQPKNQNIYVSNCDTGHITILTQTGWEKDSQVVIFEDKYYNIKDILRSMFDKMQDAKPPTISRSLVNYFRPFVEDTMEEDFENPIKKASFDKMMYIAYNHRQIPMKQHKDMEKLH